MIKSFSTLRVAILFGITALMLFPLFPQAQAPDEVPAIRTLPAREYSKVATVVMRDLKDDWNPYFKTVRKVHQPGVNLKKDEFLRLKAAANAKKEARQASATPSAQKTANAIPPTPGTKFPANNHDADPADNNLAISADGKIVSVNNTLLNVYDTTGALLSNSSLFNFASGANISFFTFDPVTVYDPVEDKFVVVFLSGASSNSSRVVIAFSQTNDPTGAWNLYTIRGNDINPNEWIDYPQVGLSTDELFITGNRAENGQTTITAGSVVWQIDKADGFSGASTITTVPHVADGKFSLHPVEGGLTLYGPEFYLLEANSANAIDLLRISNNIANNGVLEPPIALQLNQSYSMPPSADQAQSNTDLATNETRVQTSYLENGRIEFALNTGFSGLPSILHGSIELSPFLLSFSQATAQIITFPDFHIAYPALAYAGSTGANGGNNSYLAFNFAGPTRLPGLAAVWADENGFSQPVIVRTGINPITGGALQRWGDYTDAQERPGQPGQVWIAGTFGNQSSVQRSFISELNVPTPVANEVPLAPAADLNAFPSPAHERVLFEFPVETEGDYQVVIHDIQGREVKRLIQNWLAQGDARLSFNTTYLPAGTYVVSVENGSARLFSKQFAVQH